MSVVHRVPTQVDAAKEVLVRFFATRVILRQDVGAGIDDLPFLVNAVFTHVKR